MSAKVYCKKGYNTKDGYVEFKDHREVELCPVSNTSCCEECNAEESSRPRF